MTILFSFLLFLNISFLPILTGESFSVKNENNKIDYIDLNRYSDLKLRIPENQSVKRVKRFGIRQYREELMPLELEGLFDKYCAEYKLDKELLKRIAYCESTFNSQAVNGPYAGMYQFLASTWISNRKAMGLDPNPDLRFNAEESIKTTAYKISRDGTGAWPVCGKK